VLPIAISFLAGQLLSAVWSVSGRAVLGFATAMAALGASPVLRRKAVWLAYVGVALLGLWAASDALEPPTEPCFLPAADAAEKLWIEADIADLPSAVEGGIRVRSTIRAVGRSPERVCGAVLLTILEPPDLAPGDRVRVHVSLRRPRNFANPRAYDYRASLARRGIWATAHASGAGAQRLPGVIPPRLLFERHRIARLIDASLPPRDAALLRALVVGDETGLPPDLWNDVVAAGIAHVLSVSGLHIALVWGLGFAIVRFALGRSERLLLHSDVRAIAAAIALPPAALYAALAGLGVPAVRSVAMTGLLAASLAAGREASPTRVLSLAAAAIGVVSPGAPLEISFQLSFASVLALVVATRAWSDRARGCLRAGIKSAVPLREKAMLVFLVPAAALVGTAPLVALHFNRLSLAGLVTNPILVPMAGTPATVIGLAGAAVSLVSEPAARVIFSLARWPLELLQRGAAAVAAAPLASLRVPTPTLVEIALAYALLALPWIRAPLRSRIAIVALAGLTLDAAWWLHERRFHRDFRVRFLDVGQGDAAVLELPGGRVIVIDGGGFGRSRFDVGERVVAPYLWTRKIMRLDAIVATHGDWDHQGGLGFLAREFSPRELWVGSAEGERARLEGLAKTIVETGGRVKIVEPGAVADFGGVRIDCLHPPRGYVSSANDSSLVLRVRIGGSAMIFTGDIGAAAEQEIASAFEPEPIQVLKVPHHGSGTSSSDELLRWARPEIAVFSLGAGNLYGFPHPAVVARYERLASRILRTDRDGSILVSTDGARLDVRASGGTGVFCALVGGLC